MSVASADKTQINIVYPWTASGGPANYLRNLIDEANQQQSKYLFLLDVKVGASGTVAANHVLTHPGVNLLSTSGGSFFIRSAMHPTTSWNPDDFQPLFIECSDMPYIIVSKKYKSLAELKNKKRLSIGMIAGHLTELIALELKKQLPTTDLTFIYYQATSPGTRDVLGDILDLNVDVPASAIPWIEDHKLFAIAATGSKNYKQFQSFESQGMPGFKYLTATWFISSKKSLNPEVTKEIKQILTEANKSKNILNLYSKDYCSPSTADVDTEYSFWSKFWPATAKNLFKTKVD